MLEQRFHRALDNIPYARYLDLRFDAAKQCFELPFREDLIGNAHLPAVHGGAVGGFLENAAMIWLLITHAQHRVPKPVDFSVDFLHVARAQSCFAQCEVLRQGRRLAQVQVRCWQESSQRPVAAGRGHFLLELPAA